MRNNIVLVGFMASGKTTIGQILAEKLNLDFVDTDTLIEDREEMPITDIFNLKGETYFREKEKEIIDLLKNSENKIISTGGGIVTSLDNRRKLKELGQVVYLESSPKWVLSNLKRSNTIRPLLAKEEDPMAKIQELMDKRRAYYEEVAKYKVSVDEKSLHEIVNQIIDLIYPSH